MSLVVGQNSWSTVAEADTYLTDRIGAAAWFNTEITGQPGEDTKQSFLVTAFHWLQGAPQLTLANSLTDANVKNAQAEAAFWLQNHYAELDTRRAALATGLTELRESKRNEIFDPNNLTIPDHILGMLSIYQSTGGGFATLLGEYDT